MTFYLSSDGKANTLNGDGVLTTKPPASDKPDNFTYDPMHPVLSHGGNVCCHGERAHRRRARPAQDGGASRHSGLHHGAVEGRDGGERSDRRRRSTSRRDREGHGRHGEADRRVSRRHEPTIWTRRSSGCAIATGTTSRSWMEPGKVYKVALQPMTTSNYFDAGPSHSHRGVEQQLPALRPQPEHWREQLRRDDGLVAHNAVHHSKQYPSELKITVVKKPPAADNSGARPGSGSDEETDRIRSSATRS